MTTHENLLELLRGDPWMFAPGDFVRHRNGGLYQILSKALVEATREPVYVYRALVPSELWTTWTRPRAEMEDGRFTIVRLHPFIEEIPSTVDEAYRQEHAELIEALYAMVDQHCAWNDALDSGCLSANAEAIRLLARVGRVKLTGDGPGRNVSAVKTPEPESAEDAELGRIVRESGITVADLEHIADYYGWKDGGARVSPCMRGLADAMRKEGS